MVGLRLGRRQTGLVLGVAVVGVAALAAFSSSDEGPRRVEPETRLDASVAAEARRQAGARRDERPSGGRAVQVLPPGATAQGERGNDERPPDRVLKENASIRRQLDHLKAIEAEQARVARALSVAATGYDGPLQLGAGGLAWPVRGPVVSPFGQRWGRLHAGIDIASPGGTVIRAAEAGAVAIAAPTGGYGNYVCVQHTNRLTTCYAHLSRFLVERGASVEQGEPIGLVGCTGRCFGDHVHFETRISGRPVDPAGYL